MLVKIVYLKSVEQNHFRRWMLDRQKIVCKNEIHLFKSKTPQLWFPVRYVYLHQWNNEQTISVFCSRPLFKQVIYYVWSIFMLSIEKYRHHWSVHLNVIQFICYTYTCVQPNDIVHEISYFTCNQFHTCIYSIICKNTLAVIMVVLHLFIFKPILVINALSFSEEESTFKLFPIINTLSIQMNQQTKK